MKRVLSPADLARIAEALNLREQVIVRLAAFEGMRPGEILALKPSENTASLFHLILPAEPSRYELNDDELERIITASSHAVSPCCCKTKRVVTF